VALDRGERIAIDGDNRLADFIGKIGRRVAKGIKGRSSDGESPLDRVEGSTPGSTRARQHVGPGVGRGGN
jgi:hypothetical protein